MNIIVGGDEPVIVGEDEIVGRVVRRLGIRQQSRVTPDGVEVRALVPGWLTGGRDVCVRHVEPVPTIVGGKAGRKLKEAVKKIAKNKVTKAVFGVALNAAEKIPGYGDSIKAARKAVSITKQAVQKAKKSNAKAVKLGPSASAIVAKAAGFGPADKVGKVVTTKSGRRFRVVPL